MGNEIYSSVFLVSEEFDLAWADNSLRQLKKNQRRIFGGTNLFAQGTRQKAFIYHHYYIKLLTPL